MFSWSFVFSVLVFNGLIAYYYAEIKSTHRNKYPFLVAYVQVGRYVLIYLILAAATRLF